MVDIAVPTLNSNDDSYLLVEWLVPDGGRVAPGTGVAVVETSKAVTELEAAEDGYLSHRVRAGSRCVPGEVVGTVWATAEQARSQPPAAPPAPEAIAPATGPVVTRPARELMAEHGIAMDAVVALGRPLVKRADVEALVSARSGPAAGGHPPDGDRPDGRLVLSPHQRAVAATVTLAHRDIPAAYLAVKVSAADIARRQRLEAARAKAFVGVPELVLHAVAGLHDQHPWCFAEVADDLTGTPAARADIGVTIDVGTGLYVPVIRDAAALSPAEIAARLMAFRVRAMRRQMRAEDLVGARLTLALHTDPGVVTAVPIVFPGQTCCLSLCATQRELVIDDEGRAVPHEYLQVGMAYDHRFINGREATAFLTSVRAALQAPVPSDNSR